MRAILINQTNGGSNSFEEFEESASSFGMAGKFPPE
jgi:hypothetical protein